LGNINPERDVVSMMDWIRRNGAQEYAGTMDFSHLMPGYRAEVQHWRTKDYSFLLVRDLKRPGFEGYYYIYGWMDESRKYSIQQTQMLTHGRSD
jgi:hypothetical protein